MQFYWWLIFALGMVGLFLFIKLNMPPELKEVKLSWAGIKAEVKDRIEETRLDMEQIKSRF